MPDITESTPINHQRAPLNPNQRAPHTVVELQNLENCDREAELSIENSPENSSLISRALLEAGGVLKTAGYWTATLAVNGVIFALVFTIIGALLGLALSQSRGPCLEKPNDRSVQLCGLSSPYVGTGALWGFLIGIITAAGATASWFAYAIGTCFFGKGEGPTPETARKGMGAGLVLCRIACGLLAAGCSK
jgi:hypothetical protein